MRSGRRRVTVDSPVGKCFLRDVAFVCRSE